MSTRSGEGIHLLILPYPAQGHMLPLVHLTHRLALRNFTISIVVTPKNLPFLSSLLASHPSLQPLVLPFPFHPSLPSGVEHVGAVGNSRNPSMIAALSRLQDPISQWFHSHPSPPAAIISDFFLGWTVELARNLEIPRLGFYTSGAFITSIADYLWSNMEACRSLDVVKFADLPGSPSLQQKHLPRFSLQFNELDPDWEIVHRSMLANRESWGFVFNSFDALEFDYLQHLKASLGNSRIYGVGPLNLGRVSSADPEPVGNNVLRWLDGCPDDSVLYVSFGSQKLLRTTVIKALAEGLELSGIRFVWALKSASREAVDHGHGLVPEGFEEGVTGTGRGMVVKGWAPQVEILGHPAVGGFLSHCGWNSVLEAIVSGVMILAWPMEADQFVNAKLLIEVLGVAVQVWEGDDPDPDPAQIADVIRNSMAKGATAKARMEEMAAKAFEAVDDGGTSARDLEELIKHLAELGK